MSFPTKNMNNDKICLEFDDKLVSKTPQSKLSGNNKMKLNYN